MNYTLGKGIPEHELPAWLERAAKQYGTFEDGRVNYKHADIAPTVMCTVVWDDKILLLKRSHEVGDAAGYWSTVNGFIDEIKPVQKQVVQEIQEELGFVIDDRLVRIGASYTMSNPLETRSYIVFPCLVVLQSEPVIQLNDENTAYVWIRRADIGSLKILEDLPHAIDSALALR